MIWLLKIVVFDYSINNPFRQPKFPQTCCRLSEDRHRGAVCSGCAFNHRRAFGPFCRAKVGGSSVPLEKWRFCRAVFSSNGTQRVWVWQPVVLHHRWRLDHSGIEARGVFRQVSGACLTDSGRTPRLFNGGGYDFSSHTNHYLEGTTTINQPGFINPGLALLDLWTRYVLVRYIYHRPSLT